MKIDSITIENWKCFSDSFSTNLSTVEIISMPNGSGKTSLFEAIVYGLYGKTDAKLESYQNHKGQTKISIEFQMNDTNYRIEREFPNNKAIMYKNGEKFKQGTREIFEYMNSMVNFGITKRLWFKGDIASTEVLNFKFFKEEILAEKLKDPSKLYKIYNSEALAKSKQMKSLNIAETRDIKDIQSDIDDITSRLKEKTNVTDMQYTRAVQVKEANVKFDSLKKSLAEINFNPIDKATIQKWNNIDIARYEALLQEEKNKMIDAQLSAVNQNALKSIISSNDNSGKCVVCNGEWAENRSNYIKSILAKGFRDSSIISELEEKIAFKNSISKQDIDSSLEYYRLENDSNSMPNYEDVIANFNKENDLLWDKLNELNSEKERALYNQSLIDQFNKLKKEQKDAKEKVDFLKNYLNTATEAYTSSLLSRSSEILNNLNQRYSNISIAGEEANIMVTIDDEELYVSQISNGEKTIVALSLVVAIRDIFTPGMPLMFDESFATLDERNNLSIMDYLKGTTEQLFVITHNKEWKEFNGFVDQPHINIRESWGQ